MTTKIYLHLDKSKNAFLPQLDNFTTVYTLTEQITLKQLYTIFLQLYNAQYPNNVLSATIQTHGIDVLYVLHNTNSTKLTEYNTIINTLVNDKDDIFVCVDSVKFRQKHDAMTAKMKQMEGKNDAKTTAATKQTTDNNTSNTDTNTNTNNDAKTNNAPDTTVVPSVSDVITTHEALILSLLSQARSQQDTGMLRKATDIYKSALNTINTIQPITSRLRSFKQIIYQQLGVIELYNKRYKSAIDYFTHAHNIATQIQQQYRDTKSVQLTDEDKSLLSQLPTLNCLLGQALYHHKQYLQALKYFQFAQKSYELQIEKLTDLNMKRQKQADLFDIRVYIGRTMYQYSLTVNSTDHTYSKQQLDTIVQYRQKAIDLYEQLMKLNEHNVNLLVHYASIAVDVNQNNQAIPYLLRAVVDAAQQGNNTRIDKHTKQYGEQMLANITRSQWGISQLLHDLHSAAENAAALGFLAYTLKQHGNISGSIILYEKAVQQLRVKSDTKATDKATDTVQQYTLDVAEINMTLNLCHTYEVAAQYQHVFDTVKQWFATHTQAKIGSYSCKPFFATICHIRDIYDPTLAQCTSELAAKFVQMCDLVDTDVLPSDTPIHSDYTHADTTNTTKQSQLNTHPTYNQLPYTIEELNILGLVFTCVKCLYLVGAVQCIPAIVNLIEPLRKNKNLHMTVIRNEHAYYSTSIQLLKALITKYNKTTLNLYSNIKQIPHDCIYVIGDSHCLSLAYHTITIQNHTYTCIPKLVTGVKLWHLRPGSTFYTRSNFDSVLSTIPQNAVCMLVLGEIDCRDGIQQSVDKYKYNTVTDAIKYNIQLYIDLLYAVKKQKQTQCILVHPVVPVLDITRHIVTQYNNVLQQSISDNHMNKHNIHYINIYNQLIIQNNQTNQTEFNSEYKLDGTHMHPQYIGNIQQWCAQATEKDALKLPP